jgi:hypothetical protein
LKLTGSALAAKKTGIKVNIATPAYGSNYASEYVRTLFKLLTSQARPDIRFSFSEIDYSDIVASRNYLASSFLDNKPDCSHLLFMDSDMGFPVELIHRMIALGEDVVGAVYPRRMLNLEALHGHGTLPFDEAYTKALSFIGSPGAPHARDPAFRRIKLVGAGLLLVSRKCLETMVTRCPDIDSTAALKNSPFAGKLKRWLTPFDKIRLPDRELSEDFSFCHRWTEQCAGRIYAATGFEVEHVARVVLRGKAAAPEGRAP